MGVAKSLMSTRTLLGTALVLLLAAQFLPAAAAQDFEGVSSGDRIEIATKAGGAFRGEVVWVTKDMVQINVSMEGSMDGVLTFKKDDLRRVSILRSLTDEERKKILAEKNVAKPPEDSGEAKTPDNTPDKSGEAEKTGEPSKDDKAKADRLALLESFPPDDGWGEEKFAELTQRRKDNLPIEDNEIEFLDRFQEWLQARSESQAAGIAKLLEKFPPGDPWNEKRYDELNTQFIRLGVALTAEEKEFVDNFGDWSKAKAEADEKAKAEDKAKAEEEKAKIEEESGKTEGEGTTEEGTE
jgi:hypothetical protein